MPSNRQAVGLPDPIAAGGVLATLDSAQAAMACVLVAALIKAQSAIAVVAERFQSAASKLAEATTTQDTQHAVQLALLQQGQADIKASLLEVLPAIRARS
jgi:hypothetical protein